MLSCASALRRGSALGEGEQRWWSGNGVCFRVQEGDFWWGLQCGVRLCTSRGLPAFPLALCSLSGLIGLLLLYGSVRSGVLRVDALLVGGVPVSPGRCSCYLVQQDAG